MSTICSESLVSSVFWVPILRSGIRPSAAAYALSCRRSCTWPVGSSGRAAVSSFDSVNIVPHLMPSGFSISGSQPPESNCSKTKFSKSAGPLRDFIASTLLNAHFGAPGGTLWRLKDEISGVNRTSWDAKKFKKLLREHRTRLCSLSSLIQEGIWTASEPESAAFSKIIMYSSRVK